MRGLRWVQLSEDERDEFLGTGGTGVLSFGTGVEEPPSALPVSYGYSAATEGFYFRLSSPPGSDKEAITDRMVSFVTYDETDEGWRSVVATGRLGRIRDLPYDSTAVQGMWAIEIPTVDMFDRPPSEVEFDEYCLEPDTITGRKEVR